MKTLVSLLLTDINAILNKLYPDKIVTETTSNIPKIFEIVNSFDTYDFLLLPHGGQSHKTFDESIPENVKFDTTLERSIYYNQFDGFTARSNTGLEETQQYFKRLGINEFVNLLTCSDNYEPLRYPNAKAHDAGPFLPTWMYATPTFEGLRLSLSESSRFIYSNDMPNDWAEYISRITLENDKISIDVTLTPGLNVVIGGSSSGKTLFVDSLYRKICSDFSASDYMDFHVDNINVINPSSILPHYINQNFIVSVLSDKEKSVNDIEIIQKVFPLDQSIDEKIRNSLAGLKADLTQLIDSVKEIERIESDLSRIPIFTRLFSTEKVKDNTFKKLLPSDDQSNKITLSDVKLNIYIDTLSEIKKFLNENPFIDDDLTEIDHVTELLYQAFEFSSYELKIRDIISKFKDNYDETLKVENFEAQSKRQNKENLISNITKYVVNLNKFDYALQKISLYNVVCNTKTITVAGHKLSITNTFKLSKDAVLESFNKYLKSTNEISSFRDITPQSLFESNFSKRSPKVDDYGDFVRKVYAEFEKINKKLYKIETKDGKQFESISPGWKSAVLLDIILGYKGDLAPLIIDQPEDNLAADYLNSGLIKSIKEIKAEKQIILVSHNATIPMLGDAQNVILCKNENGKILIQSCPLEGQINGKSMVDYIATITDGGKPSIKKRVKKYNLKTFREE